MALLMLAFLMCRGFEGTYPLYKNVNLILRRSMLNATNVDEYLTARARAVVMILTNMCRGWSDINGMT